jgi:hypothetical protein
MYSYLLVEKKMDKEEILRKIAEEDDYIRCPKCSNSINKLISKNPDGVEDNVIARLLLTTEENVVKTHQETVKIFQEGMKDK